MEETKKMKYILVTGGVFGGVGKTVVSGAIGKMLKNHGVEVTFVKIDSYFNLDAGTSSSRGEVCILDDGTEVDVDLGHYERALDLDIDLHGDNHVTAGKIYKEVIENERRGDYFGQIVQVQPHFTNAFRNYLERVARIPVSKTGEVAPKVCIIELNGSIDDIENQHFVECFKQLQITEERHNFCMVHVSHIPKLAATGEYKTESTEMSISKLQIAGLAPDFVVCRSESCITAGDIEKISKSCRIPSEQIVNIHDVENLYKIPYLLKCGGMAEFLSTRLELTLNQDYDEKLDEPWQKLDQIIDSLTQTLSVAVVGEYTSYKNRHPTIVEALKHAGYIAGSRVAIEFIKPKDLLMSDETTLENFDCVVVTGTFGVHDTEGHIKASQVCREKKIPFLGIGLGFHTAVIEIAGTFDPKLGKEDVVIDIPEKMDEKVVDANEKCEPRTTLFKDACRSDLRLLHFNAHHWRYWNTRERINCKYQTNPKHLDVLQQNGIDFIATDSEDEQIMDIMELAEDVHPYYVGCRFHPEYTSRPSVPAPAFLGLVMAAKKQLKSYIEEIRPISSTYTVLQTYKRTPEDLRELEACNHVATCKSGIPIQVLTDKRF